MKGAKMVLIAVAETDKARSPLLIRVSAFEPPPVGVVPRTIIPMAKALPVGPGISWINTKESKKGNQGHTGPSQQYSDPHHFRFLDDANPILKINGQAHSKHDNHEEIRSDRWYHAFLNRRIEQITENNSESQKKRRLG